MLSEKFDLNWFENLRKNN